MQTVTLIPGDGTGPELIAQVVRVIEASGAAIKWDIVPVNAEVIAESMKQHGTPLPPAAAESFRQTKVMLKGPITTPIGGGHRSVNVLIRMKFGLHTNFRPCETLKGVLRGVPGLKLAVFRENTEDLYAGIEFMVGQAAVGMKVITPEATKRIAHAALKYAQRHGLPSVTVAHKANIMKMTDGLFLQTCREVSENYFSIKFREMVVDALAMQLVMNPHQFNVLVCPNLYGDILSDLCAGLIGGLGVAPGANIGDDCAMFEAVHGSAPKYEGKNKVNPTALILASCLMLEYIGQQEPAQRIKGAVAQVIGSQDPSKVTYDLGGTAGTKEMADAIIAAIQ